MESLWLTAYMVRVGRPCAFWIIHWHLPYNRGKSRKTSVSVAESLHTTRCVELTAFWGAALTGTLSISSPRLPVGDFSQLLVGTRDFQVAEVRGSLHQLILSRICVSALMWWAKNGIPKSSWICLLLACKGALLAMQRHLDCNTCSFRRWMRAAELHIGQA
jgi:hypothetical protein